MPPNITIRPFLPQEWNSYRTLRLAALTDAPDAFGSTLAVEQARSPEQWRARLNAAQVSGADLPLVALVEGDAVGLVWAKADAGSAGVIHLFQIWVMPERRALGIGSALLRQVIVWAKSRNARALQLGVTCGDTPAARLYLRAGFIPLGVPEPLREGSLLLSQTMRLELNAGNV